MKIVFAINQIQFIKSLSSEQRHSLFKTAFKVGPENFDRLLSIIVGLISFVASKVLIDLLEPAYGKFIIWALLFISVSLIFNTLALNAFVIPKLKKAFRALAQATLNL